MTIANKKGTHTDKSPPRKKSSRKYGLKSRKEVGEAMHEMKKGELHSGRSKKIVTNPKQAVAIGLSKARKSGAKVPEKQKEEGSLPQTTAKNLR